MSEMGLINESPADRMGIEQLQQHIEGVIPGASAVRDQCRAYDGAVMVWTPCIRVKREGVTPERLIELLSGVEGRRWHVWGNGSGYGPRYQEVFVEQRVGWGKTDAVQVTPLHY
jgi:hypothetical protein